MRFFASADERSLYVLLVRAKEESRWPELAIAGSWLQFHLVENPAAERI
jgi:hypothetical protein